MKKKYQSKERKSNHKFEVVGGQELLVRVPLPMAEMWAEMQAKVEELAGQAGLQILQGILEEEVCRLSARGGERGGRLRDREKQREPAIRGRQ